MSQRNSGRDRIAFDLYETPAWVADALAEHVPLAHKTIWEPAAGSGKLVAALSAHGCHVTASDITDHGCPYVTCPLDFASPHTSHPTLVHWDGIITNPPYGPRGELADAFIRRGLQRIADYGFLALLLPIDFDSAGTRADVFGDNQSFSAKIVLRKRIKWFDGPASPSQNHAWFLWKNTWLREKSTPRLLYGPSKVPA